MNNSDNLLGPTSSIRSLVLGVISTTSLRESGELVDTLLLESGATIDIRPFSGGPYSVKLTSPVGEVLLTDAFHYGDEEFCEDLQTNNQVVISRKINRVLTGQI
jgi:hypothetical protein